MQALLTQEHFSPYSYSMKRFSATKLRRARGQRSVEELAAIAGVSHQTIRNWEKGKGEPKGRQVIELAKILGRSVESFYEKGVA